MRIKDLIKTLQEYPQDIRVVVAGYEGGYNDVLSVRELVLRENENEEWFYGAHEESEDVQGFKAIALTGRNDNNEE
jgi:hypothetical protein